MVAGTTTVGAFRVGGDSPEGVRPRGRDLAVLANFALWDISNIDVDNPLRSPVRGPSTRGVRDQTRLPHREDDIPAQPDHPEGGRHGYWTSLSSRPMGWG